MVRVLSPELGRVFLQPSLSFDTMVPTATRKGYETRLMGCVYGIASTFAPHAGIFLGL